MELAILLLACLPPRWVWVNAPFKTLSRLCSAKNGSCAEFEREIMLERQREGVAKAKAEGKYKGRVPTAQRKAAEVVQLRGQGVKPEAIAEKLGISRVSVFRVLRDQRTRVG
jgi:DNA invertase Pin-like site-specific DNA recombinase